LFRKKSVLPEVYKTRPASISDLASSVEMFNVAFRYLKDVDEMFTIEDIGREWQTPGFNLATDTRLVLSPDGEIALATWRRC